MRPILQAPDTTIPRAPDAMLAASHGAAEELPSWDLSDLYPGPKSPELEADFAEAARAAKAFAARYAGRLADLGGAELADALGEYQRIEEIEGRLASYAQLQFSTDSTDPALGQFYQSVNERITTISSDLLFFALELTAWTTRRLPPRPVPRWTASSPSCGTCACSARTSSATNWRSSCMRRR